VYNEAVTVVGDPLHGLDEVPWHRLYHCYGPAGDIPGQLRALRSHDTDVRQRAWSGLFGNVYHQGNRWQASGATVPFLVALVDDPTTPDRVRILDVLSAVAVGDGRDDRLPFDAEAAFADGAAIDEDGMARLVRRVFEEDEPLRDDEEEEIFALGEAAAVRWAADAYWPAADRVDTIAAWVLDADVEIAARAAALLAWLPPTPASVSALLTVHFDQPHTQARASANLALAHLPTTDPRVNDQLAELLRPSDGLVAVTAAIALAYRLGDVLSEPALSVLVDATGLDLPLGVTGWDRAVRGFISLAMKRIGLT
jgi:hypothetical protein